MLENPSIDDENPGSYRSARVRPITGATSSIDRYEQMLMRADVGSYQIDPEIMILHSIRCSYIKLFLY
jgi:hypothetical protein